MVGCGSYKISIHTSKTSRQEFALISHRSVTRVHLLPSIYRHKEVTGSLTDTTVTRLALYFCSFYSFSLITRLHWKEPRIYTCRYWCYCAETLWIPITSDSSDTEYHFLLRMEQKNRKGKKNKTWALLVIAKVIVQRGWVIGQIHCLSTIGWVHSCFHLVIFVILSNGLPLKNSLSELMHQHKFNCWNSGKTNQDFKIKVLR